MEQTTKRKMTTGRGLSYTQPIQKDLFDSKYDIDAGELAKQQKNDKKKDER